ncbi:baseplate J/gp47 family protein [Thauera phenylacetica]|uniref:baseplate J/gp47 family protein n=1 Tax=Thauera phenylacetica TaxID=164400 RepID=UPI0039E4DF10
MPYSRPTLQQLIDRTREDLLSRLAADDVLRRADAEVYARVVAAASHALHGFIEYVARQVIIDTADAEHLERWSSIWGVTRKAAAAATGTATFSTSVGAAIPVGAVAKAFDGVEYRTTAGGTATGATLVLPIEAVEPAVAGNRTTGQSLTLVSPIPGVQPAAIASELSGGADVETDDALRVRLLARIQFPPHGGAAADYVTWALEVPGVTRAWVYPEELGIGTVTVRFMRDDDATPIPDAAEVAAVQAYIDTVRPVTADVTVVAPVASPLDLTIGPTPNTADVKAAIEDALRYFIRRESKPGGTINLSRLREAISTATGETSHTLTSPTGDVTAAAGYITTLGTITWL